MTYDDKSCIANSKLIFTKGFQNDGYFQCIGRYGMYESKTQILQKLTWIPLSKRHDNARHIIFFLQNYQQYCYGALFMSRKC